jgi:hypothetical protein
VLLLAHVFGERQHKGGRRRLRRGAAADGVDDRRDATTEQQPQRAVSTQLQRRLAKRRQLLGSRFCRHCSVLSLAGAVQYFIDCLTPTPTRGCDKTQDVYCWVQAMTERRGDDRRVLVHRAWLEGTHRISMIQQNNGGSCFNTIVSLRSNAGKLNGLRNASASSALRSTNNNIQ